MNTGRPSLYAKMALATILIHSALALVYAGIFWATRDEMWTGVGSLLFLDVMPWQTLVVLTLYVFFSVMDYRLTTPKWSDD